MAYYVSKTGVWDIQAGETELPALTVGKLQGGSALKVTCQFYARTMTDDLRDGFTFRIQETETNLITLTPDLGLVQGSDSWQLFTHHVLFQIPSAADGKETHIKIQLDSGDMNGQGVMMNFVMFAEVLN